jgi:hypothetical protein
MLISSLQCDRSPRQLLARPRSRRAAPPGSIKTWTSQHWRFQVCDLRSTHQDQGFNLPPRGSHIPDTALRMHQYCFLSFCFVLRPRRRAIPILHCGSYPPFWILRGFGFGFSVRGTEEERICPPAHLYIEWYIGGIKIYKRMDLKY